ncbi:MAG: DUF1566 domain-containing protein [Gammaproteobacteria bacterium]|nr:DUF1566 domain-containing protein [Gammaproteobacteria bacterium]
MTISLIRRAVVCAGIVALAMFIVVTPVQSAGGPFDALATQHEELHDAIADLQESVDALGQLAPPCGAGTTGQRFVVLDGGEEVCDNTTGLIWEQMPDPVGRFWQVTVDYCPTVRAGSRLPELEELISLLDYSQVFPALPAGHPFDNVQSQFGQTRYYTATERAGGGGVWFVQMSNGELDGAALDNFYSVWCVRSGNGAPDANAQ